jgi:hypothetical protein
VLEKLKQRYGLLTIGLFAVAYIFLVIEIIQSASRPMWFDEAWRPDFIDRNFSIPIGERQSYAPISLGLYLVTKLAVICIDDNFTQRITTYLALLVLPIVTFWFCRVYLNTPVAKAMILISVSCGYIIEFSTQDKPYIVDIVCTLSLILAFHFYLRGNLRLRYFLVAAVILLLLSFTVFFTLVCISIWWTYIVCRQRLSKKWYHLAIWLCTIATLGASYLYLFIKPQLTSNLYTYWQELYLHGTIATILSNTAYDLLTMFGLYIGNHYLSPGLEPNSVLWNTPQFGYTHQILGISNYYGVLYLVLFVYGCIVLWRDRKIVILWLIAGFYSLEWITSLARQWAFGNARTNLFSTYLITIVVVYGLINLIKMLIRRKNLVAISLLAASIVIILPYYQIITIIGGGNTYGGGTFGADSDGYASGVQQAAVYVAAHSQRPDVVLVSGYIGPFGFQYYYDHSDYTAHFRSTESNNVLYSLTNNMSLPVVDTSTNNSTTIVWAVDIDSVVSSRILTLQKDGFKIISHSNFRDVSVVKLALKPNSLE